MVKDSHRLHALCSYFAMFPGYFARGHIRNHSAPGELILDPFSGRGTTLLESLLTQRNAVASDPNPVAYCITRQKANPSSHNRFLIVSPSWRQNSSRHQLRTLRKNAGFSHDSSSTPITTLLSERFCSSADTSGGIPIPLIALYQLCCWGASMEKETNLLAT